MLTLKLRYRAGGDHALLVAPYVGAWIETFLTLSSISPALVAPYVGAWIETC